MGFAAPDILPIDEIPAGTSLLIAGPSLTRKRELLLRLLADGPADDGVAIITTKKSAGKLLAQYRGLQTSPESPYLRVIDCVSKERGLGNVRNTETTRYISSARDMTGLSIEVSGLFRDFYNHDIRTRVGLHSLSTFLMYHDLQRVYRMVHVLGGQITKADWLGAFVVDSPNKRELNMLTQLVDGMIQTRETEDGEELRIRGLGSRSTGWVDY